jgi:hypothetical protein
MSKTVQYIDEPVADQADGVLLDEYVRCAYTLWEYQAGEDVSTVGIYAQSLRDEIVRRMRGNENG